MAHEKILVVEDDGATALALGEILKDEGFDVTIQGDGEAGLKSALELHPDVILADLKMPKMGGMEMIKEIRKDEWGKGVEILILTNVSDIAVLEEAMTHNAFHYFVKGDSNIADVVAKVRERLAAKANTAS